MVHKTKIKQKTQKHGVETGKDICYGCGKSFPYGILKDVSETGFEIYCKKCKPELYK